jgi:hypothetical protein
VAYTQKHYDAEWVQQAVCSLCRWLSDEPLATTANNHREQLDGTLFCARACPDGNCRIQPTTERINAWIAWRDAEMAKAERIAAESRRLAEWRQMVDEITFYNDRKTGQPWQSLTIW